MSEQIIKHYLELDNIAMEIAKNAGNIINTLTHKIESKCPYKAQYVLEKLIEILEQAV